MILPPRSIFWPLLFSLFYDLPHLFVKFEELRDHLVLFDVLREAVLRIYQPGTDQSCFMPHEVGHSGSSLSQHPELRPVLSNPREEELKALATYLAS